MKSNLLSGGDDDLFASKQEQEENIKREVQLVQIQQENKRLEEEMQKKNSILAKKFGTMRSLTFDNSAQHSVGSSFSDPSLSVSRSIPPAQRNDFWYNRSTLDPNSDPLTRRKDPDHSEHSKTISQSTPTSPTSKMKPFKTKSMASFLSPTKSSKKKEYNSESGVPSTSTSKRVYLSSSKDTSVLPKTGDQNQMRSSGKVSIFQSLKSSFSSKDKAGKNDWKRSTMSVESSSYLSQKNWSRNPPTEC
eukprot:TRINITY_DN2343_c0_g1_i4.p1 TRINITY_DN2343_c0_g1~~TRINITY_DN2343_c0_g1_i4.p1  ORF type:complete len:247 (+),score=93.57 TRINITY_DN2343_c0_g1_i4:634-1374(+)